MESEVSSSDDQSACESSGKNSISGGGGGATNTNGGPNTSKTGRKGDPRMHRAVGARLANPKISLFDALQIGGFDYDNDDDANAVDSEQITLAQRKNQLSRRIRLALKLHGTKSYGSSNNCLTSTLKKQATKWPSKMTGIHHVSGKNRQNLSSTDAFSQSEGSVTSSNLNSIPNRRKGIGCSTNLYHIRARQHPDYHPLMIGMNASALESIKTSSEIVYVEQQKDIQNKQHINNGMYSLQDASNLAQYKENKTAAHPPSAVAITSLSHTAASLGMTLEQLALTLRCRNDLSKIIDSGPTITKQQKQLALSLYETEIRSTYQRAMLLAGYKPEIVQNEQSPEYVQFMIDAWHMEGVRLSIFMAEHSLDGDAAINSRESLEQGFQSKVNRDNIQHSNDDHHGHHEHTHDHKHQHNHTNEEVRNGLKKSDTKKSKGSRGGRHIHLLEGKCGHQPVLHQPTGGTPHIDFVIGDRVECYHNVQPSQDLKWPSSYNCEDLSCSDACGDIRRTESASSLLLRNGSSNDLVATASNIGGCDPKIYDRSELNFESDEWNFDFEASDSLLGLFKLGDVQQQQQHQQDHEVKFQSNE